MVKCPTCGSPSVVYEGDASPHKVGTAICSTHGRFALPKPKVEEPKAEEEAKESPAPPPKPPTPSRRV